MFDRWIKWEHASFGCNTTSVNNMGTCQFRLKQNVGWAFTKKPSRPTLYIFYATPKQENSLCNKKNIICQRAFLKKNCAMSAEKYQSGLLHDRCRLLSFLFNPLMKYAWCRKGNVRSVSCGDASFLTSIGHLSWRTSTDIFFNQYRWKIFFCRDGLMFSWPNKCEYASFGRNKTSVELAQKKDRKSVV